MSCRSDLINCGLTEFALAALGPSSSCEEDGSWKGKIDSKYREQLRMIACHGRAKNVRTRIMLSHHVVPSHA